MRGWGGCVVLLAALGCGDPGEFLCFEDEDCVAGDEDGRCEANGHCSFPDEVCPSGWRYGEFARAVGGRCVREDSPPTPATEPIESDAGGACGDGVRDGEEVCDGVDFGELDCAALGFDGGTLLCAQACDAVDTTQCLAAECRGPGEPCDGPQDCCESGCGKNGSSCLFNGTSVCC